MKSIFEGLNPQQEAAVKAPFDCHCLILAGAGCGKTMVLTRRIAWCSESYCSQERILALTFTRKAAEEMRARAMRMGSIKPDLTPPSITTFHGFGLGVLRDSIGGVSNSRRLGFSSEPRLISGRERLELLASVSSSKERTALGVDILMLDNIIACREADSENEKIQTIGHSTILDEILRRYEAKKLVCNVWEFSDMISRSLVLFEKFPDVRSAYASRFAHLMVDEFQDTSPLQIRLLDSLLSGGARIFAVGDDDQAIYAFRGADSGPTLNFNSRFAGSCLLKLEINYRSRPAILKSANMIFSKKPLEYRKVLVSGRYSKASGEQGLKPKKIIFDSQEEMVAGILRVSRRISQEASLPVNRMCMLFRLNETLDYASLKIKSMNLPDEETPLMMTVHGSKGLEFPVIFLCDLEEGQFPNYKRQAAKAVKTWPDLFRRIINSKSRRTEFDIEEETRLFYVGVTRAMERLFLVSCLKKQHNGRTIRFSPSRFRGLI